MEKVGAAGAEPHLVQGLHHAHHVVEDDHGLPLAEPLLLDDVVLQVDQVGGLVAEVVCAEAVEDEADALLHFLNHSAGFCVLNNFTGAVLGGRGQTRAWLGARQGQGLGALFWSLELDCMCESGRGLRSGEHGPWAAQHCPAFPVPGPASGSG